MAGATPEEKLLGLIKKAQGKLRLKKELKLFTKINLILIGLIIVILAIFLVDIFSFKYNIPEPSVDLSEQEVEVLPVVEDVDEDIEEVIEKRVSISKKDLTKNLNLLGIITGDNDQAIIEDKEAKKTFFLYEGDSFGEFTVYDIKESSVILDYKGEKIKLKI